MEYLLYVVGIYFFISYIFLKYPLLIHKKKNKLKLPLLKDGHTHYVQAHRGGSVENPENTLQAFKHAVSKFQLLNDNWNINSFYR